MRAFISQHVLPGKLHAVFLLIVWVCLSIPLSSRAFSSYARQTGQNCESCHVGGQFPELTSYGRVFKLTNHSLGSRHALIPELGVVSPGSTNIADPSWLQNVPENFSLSGSGTPLVSQLGQKANGAGVYALWNNLVYAELTAYRTGDAMWPALNQEVVGIDQLRLKGLNPSFRLALRHEWGAQNAMIGIFGSNADVYTDNLNPGGPTARFRDRGVDAQYQYFLDSHSLSAQFSFINESISGGDVTGLASNSFNSLKQLKLKASYLYRDKYGAGLSYFGTTGNPDDSLYGSSALMTPDTRGWTPEVFWTPRPSLRIGAQYVNYNRFNGISGSYDGSGRDVKDNNALFFYIWGSY